MANSRTNGRLGWTALIPARATPASAKLTNRTIWLKSLTYQFGSVKTTPRTTRAATNGVRQAANTR